MRKTRNSCSQSRLGDSDSECSSSTNGTTPRRTREDGRTIIIIRLPEVIRRTGLKKTTIYTAIAEGRFPLQVRISLRAVGWIEHEIAIWLQQNIERRNHLLPNPRVSHPSPIRGDVNLSVRQ